MALIIKPEYLFNFTEKEKKAFYKQHKQECVDIEEYQLKLYEKIYSDSKDIFANYGARPFSILDVKYTINRLAKDDPELTHLPFGYGDPVQGNSDAIKIAKAIQTNTHCKVFELADCGFTDSGAILILNALKDKEISIDLRGNRMTDATFQYALQIMAQPENRWSNLSFGLIRPSEEVRKALNKQPKIKYKYRERPFLACIIANIFNKIKSR